MKKKFKMDIRNDHYFKLIKVKCLYILANIVKNEIILNKLGVVILVDNYISFS